MKQLYSSAKEQLISEYRKLKQLESKLKLQKQSNLKVLKLKQRS